MITKKETTIKIKANADGVGEVSIAGKRKIDDACFAIADPDGKETKIALSVSGGEAKARFKVENPRLWDTDEPNLYSFRCKIFSGGEQEEARGTFGFRSISTDGKNVCINGNPIFVRGYIRGATAHDHGNIAGLDEKEFCRKNVTEAKKFGFNYVRFHSSVPSEAFMNAADEAGILVHIELREPHDIYNNLEEMTTTGKSFVSDEFLDSVVNRLFNHPSFAVYCLGNEIRNLADSALSIAALRKKIYEKDGTRLFLDTCAWGANGRANTDLDVQHFSYYFPFGKHADMFENTENLLVVGDGEREMRTEGENAVISRSLYFNVPIFAHEVCHYTALRDYKKLKEKFVACGAEPPWWIDQELNLIEEKGYAANYDEVYRASKSFQFFCWKTALEALRTSPVIGGFHFLQLADTDVYENSNGLIDCFDDENVVSPEEFLKFNGNRVLVAKVAPYLFYGGSQVNIPVYLSTGYRDGVVSADFAFTLTGRDGKIYADGKMSGIDVSRGGVNEICRLAITLPQITDSERLTLAVSLVAGGKTLAVNEWNVWVYERKKRRCYGEFVSFRSGDVSVTDDIDSALERLEKGEKVCLVYRSEWTRHVLDKTQSAPKYAFRATLNRFKPVIWDRGTNYGGLCDEKTLKAHGFDTDRFYGVNACYLSEDCDKIITDDFPFGAKILISGIDKSCRDRFDAYKGCFNLPDIMGDRTWRKFAYLFELGVGKGKLLVCGLNMTGLDRDEPSTACMADFILRYLASADFNPTESTSVAALREYLGKCARTPVKERTMTQFWEADDEPVESARFWKESREYLSED